MRWQIINASYGFLLRRLKLTHSLPTGITVRIASFADWSIYNDVFVDGEYDAPIRMAFSKADGKIRILDLGANVGLFLKRVLHIRRSEFPQIAVEIICVEGAPETFAILQCETPTLLPSESVELLHGLAGKRSGHAFLTRNAFHAMTKLARNNGNEGIRVEFVDLSKATQHWENIDLLKCDIEGAEQMVFENYGDLLLKVEIGVCEFHLYCTDRTSCLRIAKDKGLTAQQTIYANQHVSVDILVRK